MYQFLLVIHMFVCLGIVALVLVQQGKGASMGAAFGSGASQTVFGSRGSGSFLLKVTAVFVLIFFSTSIVLNNIAAHAVKSQKNVSVMPMQADPVKSTTQISPPVKPLSAPSDKPATSKHKKIRPENG